MSLSTPTRRVLFVRRSAPVVLAVVGIFLSLGLGMRTPTRAYAATQNTVNFQARLQTAAGAIVPDGNYNVEFKLYNTDTGGTALWTEDYFNENSTGVRVVNGYLSVNLGSVTAFTTNINWDQQLWLTMNIGGTSVGAPTMDGEMNPRLKLTAVPYAFSAGKLSQYNSTTGFTSTLNMVQPTVGDQIFQIPDQGAAGTFNILTQNTADNRYIQLQSSPPGTAQTGYFNISGTGTANTFNASSALQTAGVTRIDSSGNLTNIGNVTASGNIQQTGSSATNYLMGALGLGTTNPQTGSALTIANGKWISSVDAAGTGYINMFTVNSNNQIQVGASLNVDGSIVLPTNGGQVTFSDLPIDISAASGTKESYTMRVGSTNALTVYGEADGAGNAQNVRVAIGSSITPGYTLDVSGDINSSGSYRVGGTQGATTTCTGGQMLQNQVVQGGIVTGGTCATPGVQGTFVTLQSTTPGTADHGSFNIDGTGIAGTLQANNFDTAISGGTLNLGTTNATNVTVGTTTSTGTLTLGQSTVGNTINIGNNTVTSGVEFIAMGTSSTGSGWTTIIIGSTNGNSATEIDGGTGGGIAIGASGNGTPVTIGNESGAVAQGIFIGDNLTAGANTTVKVGSLTGSSTTTLQAGTGNLNFITNNASAGAIFKTKTNSATALQVQNSNGDALLAVDTSASTITFGTGGNTITISSTGISLSGTAQKSKRMVLAPEYAGAVLDSAGDGACTSANSGTLTSAYDNVNLQNYYNWTSSSATSQCYDVVVQVAVPSDFAGWAASDPINVQAKTDNTGNTGVAIEVLDAAGNPDSNYGSSYATGTLGTSWGDVAGSSFGGSYSAGSVMTIRIRMSASNASNLQLGTITLNYKSQY